MAQNKSGVTSVMVKGGSPRAGPHHLKIRCAHALIFRTGSHSYHPFLMVRSELLNPSRRRRGLMTWRQRTPIRALRADVSTDDWPFFCSGGLPNICKLKLRVRESYGERSW